MPANRPAQHNFPDIDGYRLTRVLGEGGMSTVYLAMQESLRREVAVKVIRKEALSDDVARRRFENEARTIARLDHPHIVRIYEVGHTRDELSFYAMPVLPKGHVGRRALVGDETRVRAILEALLSALGYAHSRGVVHRDVKAENVLFDAADRPMLTDFGIALRRGYGSRVTSTGLAVGSTAYMSPEQARGIDVDHRTDLYSLGVLAWEMLTGGLPYRADDALSMALKHVQDPIPELPPELRHWQAFFDRALAKVPAERFMDAAEMAVALRAVPHAQRQPVRAALARLAAELGGRRRRWLWATAATLALVGGVVVVQQMGLLGRSELPPSGELQGAAASSASLSQTPGIDPTRAAPGEDPSQAMLRAPPMSAAQPHIDAAQRHIAQRRYAAPAGNNAYESLIAAWNTDPTHSRLADLTASLVDTLSDQALQRLRDGQDRDLADLISRIQRLVERDRARNADTLLKLQKSVAPTLEERMRAAENGFDREAGQRIAGTARDLGLPAATVAGLKRRADAIAQPGDRIAANVGNMTLTRSGDDLIAIAQAPVSRRDYEAFVKATRRETALCRERASLLRVIAPRDWKTPGFDQRPDNPVVCVSWKDAEAFARWHSQRENARYRLPTAAEAQALARGAGAKPVAEWLADCAPAGCSRRMADGSTWRGAKGRRSLDADRGYDDVGFRLVREL